MECLGRLAGAPEDGLHALVASTWTQRARRHWVAVVLVGAGVALGLSGLRGERGVAGVSALRRELRQLESESFDLLQAGEKARRQLEALQTDDAELERVARRELQLVRPGEVLYVQEDPRRPRPPRQRVTPP